MANQYEKYLNRSVVIVIMISYMALCTTPAYNITTLFIPAVAVIAIPIVKHLQQRYSFYTTCSTIISVAFMCFLPVYILSNGLIDGVILLFMYVQLYSLLHRKERSNYLHILMMSLFLFIATLVLSPSAIIGFIFVAFMYFSISSLLYLDSYHYTTSGIYLPPQGNPSLSSENKVDGSITSSPLFSRALVLGICTVCTTLFLFMFIPRTEAGLMASSLQIERSKAGQAEKTRFDIVGTITGNTNLVMKISFIEQPGGRYDEEKYWRATTLPKYSSQGWARQGLLTKAKNLHPYTRNFRNEIQYRGNARRKPFENTEKITYDVVFSKQSFSPVPLLNSVIFINPSKPKLYISAYWIQGGDFTIGIQSKSTFNNSFRVTSQAIDPSANELRQTSNNYSDIMLPGDYQLLTEHNLQERTLNLIQDLTADKETTYDKIIALENYLTTNEFIYTDVVPQLNKDFPLDNFIHDVKRGHCELYAGAMTVMVRSLDVPARTVSGYRGGLWNDLDNTYAITENMAHLWLEVYFPEFGWVKFDPTPAFEDSEMTRIERFQAHIDYTLTRMRNFWLQYFITYKPKFEYNPFKGKSFVFFGGWISSIMKIGTPRSFTLVDHLKGILFLLLPMMTIIMAYLLYHRRRNTLKHQRYILNATQAQAREVYLRLIHKLSRLGIDIRNLTAEELLETLRKVDTFPDVALDELAEFIMRYHEIRFGRQPLLPKELERYTTMIKQLQHQPSQ